MLGVGVREREAERDGKGQLALNDGAGRWGRWLPAALLALALAHNLHMGWRAWGDLVVDSGRELEVPRQLAEGQILYADVRYYYGPLAPYVNAALFRLLGAHAEVLMAAGAASAVLMAGIVHLLTLRFTGRLGATLATAAFLYLCAFAHLVPTGAFNWVLPYAYPATYGMLAAAASLLFLLRHLDRARGHDLALSVGCLVLASLGKLEALLPAMLAHGLFVAARWRSEGRGLLLYAAAAAASVGVYVGFALAAGPALVTENLGAAFNARSGPVIARFMGLGDWPLTAIALLESATALAVAAGLTYGIAWLARRSSTGWQRAAVAAASVAAPLAVYATIPYHRAFRVLPPLAAAMVVWWGVAWLRSPARRDAVLPHVLLWAFALASLARMPLVAGSVHYGFYLLPVPLLALVVLWFADLPRVLPGSPAARRIAALTGTVLLAAVVVPHVRASAALYRRHTVRVSASRGTMWLLGDLDGFPVGEAQAEAIRRLAALPPATRVLALPEGVGLGFLAGLQSWDGMHSFLPPELPTPADDERLVARLARDPPDVVLWVGIDLAEYGTTGFGNDYAQHTLAWIRDHYETEAAIGPRNYLLLLRRKPG